jgi:predicted N-acetyltransferase YhbS
MDGILIQRREEDALTAVERSQLSTLLFEAFGPPFDRRLHYKQLPCFRFVALNGAAVAIGQVGVCHRMMRLGDESCRVFGIVDLCVAKDRRGQGLGRRLTETVINAAAAAEADFVLLFADTPSLYTDVGFRGSPNPCVWWAIDEHRSLGTRSGPPPGLLMTLTLGPLAWNDEAELDLLGHLF